MINYTTDFSYLDKDYVLRRETNYQLEAINEIEAALFIRATFHVIKIREIKEVEAPISPDYKGPIWDFNHRENLKQ